MSIENEVDIPEWHKKILDDCLLECEYENKLVSASEVRKKIKLEKLNSETSSE